MGAGRRAVSGLVDAGDPGGLRSGRPRRAGARRRAHRAVVGHDAVDAGPAGRPVAAGPLRRAGSSPAPPAEPGRATCRTPNVHVRHADSSAEGRHPVTWNTGPRCGRVRPVRAARISAATTSRSRTASTSGCRRTDTWCAPSVLIGAPTSTRRLSTTGPPAALIAEAMSAGVIGAEEAAGVTGAGTQLDLDALELRLDLVGVAPASGSRGSGGRGGSARRPSRHPWSSAMAKPRGIR